MKPQIPSVDAYILALPVTVQKSLRALRVTIKKIAPDAQESISYGMPAYKLNGKPLIYFAAFKNHIGLYATPYAHSAFAQELADYKQGKGSVQFPLLKPLPMALITRILKFKKQELHLKSKVKK